MHKSNFFVREYFNERCNYAEVIVSSKLHSVADPGECWSAGISVVDDEDNERVEPEEERKKREERCVADSLRRARKQVKFLTLNNITCNFRMLTLTYAGSGNWDRSCIARDVQHMVERLEKREKRDIRYICAFEKHPSGHGYHAHLLIECAYYRNETFQAEFWKHGFVKLKKMWFKNRVADALNAARYITKYITKDADDSVKNNKRYSSSRNLFRNPYRYDLKFATGDEIREYVDDIKARGYRFLETYSYTIDGENFQVAFYQRKAKCMGVADRFDAAVASIATMFGADAEFFT